MNTCIVIDNRLVDIGIPVIRWDDPGGFDGYTTRESVTEDRKTGKDKVIRGKRYNARKGGVESITQLFVHHSGGDGRNPSGMYQTLWMDRALSVQFAIEDDGRVYQFLDAVERAWHGGKHNGISVGAELCLYPDAGRRPGYYSPANCKRRGNIPHSVRFETLQGSPRKVFVMPDVQVDAFARVMGGVWAVVTLAKREPISEPLFPRVDGKIPKEKIENAKKHTGLIGHLHCTKKKIDPAGFNFEEAERLTGLYASAFRTVMENPLDETV